MNLVAFTHREYKQYCLDWRFVGKVREDLLLLGEYCKSKVTILLQYIDILSVHKGPTVQEHFLISILLTNTVRPLRKAPLIYFCCSAADYTKLDDPVFRTCCECRKVFSTASAMRYHQRYCFAGSENLYDRPLLSLLLSTLVLLSLRMIIQLNILNHRKWL